MLWAPNYCEPSRPEGQDVEAPGSAVAGPATAPRPSPRFLRPSQLDLAGLGSQGLRLQGVGGRALGSAKWGVTWVCPGCASGILQFQRSGEGVVVYTEPCYSPVLSRGPSGPSPVAGLEAVPPQMYGTCPRRPRVLGRVVQGNPVPAGQEASDSPAAALGNPERALCSLSSQCPSYIVFCS